MSDETRLLDRIHDTLQTQGYQPMTTYEQAVISGQGLTSRIEHWIGPRGTRLIQVSIVYGVVSDVEVYAPLVESTSAEDTLKALLQQ